MFFDSFSDLSLLLALIEVGSWYDCWCISWLGSLNSFLGDPLNLRLFVVLLITSLCDSLSCSFIFIGFPNDIIFLPASISFFLIHVSSNELTLSTFNEELSLFVDR